MTAIRIDKYLSQLELFTRKRSAPILKKWGFWVNRKQIFDKKTLIDDWDSISREDTIQGHISVLVKTELTLTIYKPAWYVSSDVDEAGHPSRKQLLLDTPYQRYLPMLHIAWRLDVDTEWLILVTSDGKLNHRIISPKRHLKKVYIVTCRDDISKKECTYLAKGVILDDGYKTKPALVEQLENNVIRLTITEGKYHQVKRMLLSLGNKVTHLERIAIGPRTTDDMEPWTIYEITDAELLETLWREGK